MGRKENCIRSDIRIEAVEKYLREQGSQGSIARE